MLKIIDLKIVSISSAIMAIVYSQSDLLSEVFFVLFYLLLGMGYSFTEQNYQS